MLFNVSIKHVTLAAIGILVIADGMLNVFVGFGSANKTLVVPEIPEVISGDTKTLVSFDPDAVDDLFGLSAVLSARHQAREAQKAELAKESGLAAQEPERAEQLLVIGEDQFRLLPTIARHAIVGNWRRPVSLIWCLLSWNAKICDPEN